jgi:hypothetical protein
MAMAGIAPPTRRKAFASSSYAFSTEKFLLFWLLANSRDLA